MRSTTATTAGNTYWVPPVRSPNLRKTNFIFYLTGQIYSLLGPDLIAAFVVFGIAAFVGAYLWYRATASAVPSLNRKMYCALLFFAPSLAFWPSSVGKEAVMLLAMGLAALGTARLLSGSLLKGFLDRGAGRLVAVARATALAGIRDRRGRRSPTSSDAASGAKVTSASLKKPIGLARWHCSEYWPRARRREALGMKDFSIASIEQELSDTSAQTSQGGSKIDSGSDSNSGQVHLTPLSLPQGFVTVLLRPFPWEVESGSQIIASVECAFFAYLVVHRRRSVAASLRQLRASPFLFYCWVLLAFYAVAYSSFGNMGLLVRQRSLMLPAFFAIISVEPVSVPGGSHDDDDGSTLRHGAIRRPGSVTSARS